MAGNNVCPANVIAELRLRRWARENYVPEQERHGMSWHPIVLDEMKRRDTELRQCESEYLMTSTYVPLAPTTLRDIHWAHTEQVAPYWMREQIDVQTHPG